MDATRRTMLFGATALMASCELPSKTWAEAAPGGAANGVKALVYDVFGTVVDWRNGVARDAERILKPLGYNLDWLAFADAWRALYQPTMEEVRSGRVPFVKLDILHRRMLDQIRPKFGLRSSMPRWRTISTSPGIGSTRGRTWRPATPACIRSSSWRRARTGTSR